MRTLCAALLVAAVLGCQADDPPGATNAILEQGETDLSGMTLCALAQRIGEIGASSSGGHAFSEVSGHLSLSTAPSRWGADIELFRVTSGFSTHDGRFGVTNAGMNEVLIFGRDGSVASRVGRPGPGPSEFISLFFSHVRPEDERVLAFDAGSQAVKWFSLAGEFLGGVRLSTVPRTYDVWPLDDGRYLAQLTGVPVVTGTDGLRRSEVSIVLLGQDGVPELELSKMRGRDNIRWSRPGGGWSSGLAPFTTFPWMVVEPEGCFLHPTGEQPGFRVVGLDGGEVFHGQLPFVELEVSRDDLARRIAERDAEYRSHSEGVHRRPAWSDGVFDGHHRLWLEDYRHLDEAAPGWWVVDLAAGWASYLRAPPGTLRMLAVTPAEALILMRGEHDQETLWLFEVLDRS